MRLRLAGALLIMMLCAACGGESPAVQMVKAGKVAVCGDKNIEQMVGGVFKNAQWSEQTEKQKTFVVAKGTMPVSGKEITAALRFEVNGNDFSVEDLSYNEVPQNVATTGLLMIEMCAKK